MPTTSVVPVANATTTQSTRIASSRGRPSGTSVVTVRSPSVATSTPTTAAHAVTSRLSASCCRMMRPRPAPSAARTTSSVRRASPRTRSRLATLAPAMNRRSPTAASRIESACPDVADDDVLEAVHHRLERHEAVGAGPLGVEARRHRAELLGGLREGRLGTQPGHDLHVAQQALAELRVRLVARERPARGPDLHAAGVLEVGRHHADDHESALARDEATSDDRRVSPEDALPPGVRQHHRPLGALAVVGGGERAPQHRRRAEHGEELPHHHGRLRGERCVAVQPHVLPRAVVSDAGHGREAATRSPDLLDVRGAVRHVRGPVGRHAPGHHEPVLARQREGPQQDAAHEGEDDRGPGHADGQRQHGRGVEPRGAAGAAQRLPQVAVPEDGHLGSSILLPDSL